MKAVRPMSVVWSSDHPDTQVSMDRAGQAGKQFHVLGKAQKGHLAFEATFESANLGKVDFVQDTEYDIYIRPDTCNPRHR